MKNLIEIILMVLVVASCNETITKDDLNGCWYYCTDEFGYSEICFSDSLFTKMSQTSSFWEDKYYLKGDSIYFQIEQGKYAAFKKILRLEGDTMWVLAKYPEKLLIKESWVRFPKEELGELDLKKTIEEDSLSYSVQVDFDRRLTKYYFTKQNTLRKYDSLLKAGFWNWNLKLMEKRRSETIQKLEKKLEQLEADSLAR